MTGFDLSPLFRSTVGFDRLANVLDHAVRDNAPSYPPYDIVAIDNDNYRITMAVAGFSEDELNLQVEAQTLSVTGTRAATEESEGERYLHRGIARREFSQRFRLADHVKVTGADLSDGLLTIELALEIPEAQRPRTIPIGEPKLQAVAQSA